MAIVQEYYDAAVFAADPVEARAGFSEMLGNGARIVLVENASRFARDIMVQLLGHALLKKHDIALIPVDAPGHFTEETPTGNMLRTILGAVSQFEKEALVLKLRKARERKRKETGRCEGNPAWMPVAQATVTAAREARARGLSLRRLAAELAGKGLHAPSGAPYGAQSIKRILDRPTPS